ncbi:MAG: hypothetical protein K2J20_00845 [Bacilli bacterium]|nr:hypothetical protein [Bacilli bacterium]
MENLEFRTKKDLDKYLSRFPVIGNGTEGVCYLLDGKWVLKKFKTFRNRYLDGIYLQFKKVRIDKVSFARYSVYVDGFLGGVISPYIKGANILYFSLANEEIIKAAWAAQNLVLTIRDVSDNGIWLDDIWEKNLIYHNKRLGIIDTTKCRHCVDDKGLEKDNLIMTMQAVISSVFMDRSDDRCITKFMDESDSWYKDYDQDIYLLQNPKELLLGVKAELEEYLQMPIERFSDVAEPLKRILEK